MSRIPLEDVPKLFGYEFFQMALIGGIIVAISCSLVGLLLILRKEAMIGDGVAHTAFGGVAIGLYLGINPLFSALAISILSVITIAHMKRMGLANSDSAIAVILALGFSTGLIVISLADGFNIELFNYLFGSILTITREDLYIAGVLGIIIILFIGIFYKELMAITFDEKSARLLGVPTRTLELCFNILVAFTIVLSIQVIGIILVVALLVLPGLTALQLKMSFVRTTIASIVFGSISVVLGIILSAMYDLATSGVIVFTAAGIFLWVAIYERFS